MLIVIADPACNVAGEWIHTNVDTSATLDTILYLDREMTSQYDLAFHCHDNGSPSMASSAVIHVTLSDENDHMPVFSQNVYTIRLQENNLPGTFLTRVNAQDADTGLNGKVFTSAFLSFSTLKNKY